MILSVKHLFLYYYYVVLSRLEVDPSMSAVSSPEERGNIPRLVGIP